MKFEKINLKKPNQINKLYIILFILIILFSYTYFQEGLTFERRDLVTKDQFISLKNNYTSLMTISNDNIKNSKNNDYTTAIQSFKDLFNNL